MKYKKGDRILFNRLMFGTVYQDQTSDSVVHATFDRQRNVVQGVQSDLVELVADAHHEAVLAALINRPWKPEAETPAPSLADSLTQLADELASGADQETNVLRLRTTMKYAARQLRDVAKDLEGKKDGTL